SGSRESETICRRDRGVLADLLVVAAKLAAKQRAWPPPHRADQTASVTDPVGLRGLLREKPMRSSASNASPSDCISHMPAMPSGGRQTPAKATRQPPITPKPHSAPAWIPVGATPRL